VTRGLLIKADLKNIVSAIIIIVSKCKDFDNIKGHCCVENGNSISSSSVTDDGPGLPEGYANIQVLRQAKGL